MQKPIVTYNAKHDRFEIMPSNAHDLIHCLRVAADRFREDMKVAAESHPRLAKQFDFQAQQADAFADALADADEESYELRRDRSLN
jgi:hypothetical protein